MSSADQVPISGGDRRQLDWRIGRWNLRLGSLALFDAGATVALKMSDLRHQRSFGDVRVTSAYPDKQTLIGGSCTSALGHFRTLANSVVQRRPKAALFLGLSARLGRLLAPVPT